MRILNQVILEAGDLAASVNSEPFALQDMFGYAIQCVLTGAPVGTLKLQGSNDAPPDANFQYPNFAPANWIDISGTSTNITTAVNLLFNAQGAYYRYVRVVYTKTSGTGAITVTGNAKGL